MLSIRERRVAGRARLGRAGPGTESPALRLATGPRRTPEGLHPGLAAAPRSALLALWVALLWGLIFGPR